MDIPAIFVLCLCVVVISIAALILLTDRDRNTIAVILGSIWVTMLTIATIAQGVVILVWLNTPH